MTPAARTVRRVSIFDRVTLDSATGCFVWQGRRDTHGYGQVKHGRQQAHRAAYEEVLGTIPPGNILHHLCENRLCVRPSHLVPVSVRTNTRMGKSMWRDGLCTHGHDDIGTRATTGIRYCRTCNRMRAQRADLEEVIV